MKKTEVTVQVYDSFEDIDKKFKDQGFKVTGTYYLNDWYFSKNKDVKKCRTTTWSVNLFCLGK